MNAPPPENPEVASNKNSQFNIRMAESDLKPLKQAAEAADLNMSTLVREALLRYGQQTIIELVQDREFQASGAYRSTGKRRLRRNPRLKDVPLVEMVSWKYEIATDTARQWIVLERITFDGAVITNPEAKVPADAADRVNKASA